MFLSSLASVLPENKGLVLHEGYKRVLQTADHAGFAPAEAFFSGLIDAVVANPQLLRYRLLRHATGESSAGSTLESLAMVVDDDSLRSKLRRHSEDERRHGVMLNEAAALIDAGDTDNYSFGWIDKGNEDFVESFSGDIRSFFCDLNIAEIRTFNYFGHYIHALEGRAEDWAHKLVTMFRKIQEDEAWHIAYTAELLSTWMENDELIENRVRLSLREFDRLTWHDVEEIACIMREWPRSYGYTHAMAAE